MRTCLVQAAAAAEHVLPAESASRSSQLRFKEQRKQVRETLLLDM